jgi:iron complex outermembrane receptor protein
VCWVRFSCWLSAAWALTVCPAFAHTAQDLRETGSLSAADLAAPLAGAALAQAGEPQSAPPEADLLDEVTVSATRRPTRERDTTATTYTVKREDFQALGARTVPDALALVPSFETQPALGGVRNARGLFLRGFDDARFQVLKDGLSLTRPSNGRNDLSRLPLADIDRIEVLTGGATLRYGAGAVGGVINLITETPAGAPKLTLAYEAGSYGNSTATAKYGGGDGTFHYLFTYTGLVAFNNYPFRFTLPNTALFYSPEAITPDGTSLFGFLRPEVGPPLTVTGVADSAFNASDTYTGKLVWRPSAEHRFTLRASHQNSKNAGNGPGLYAAGACFGGPGSGNATLDSQTRFLPLDAAGRELPCDTQRYLVSTPSAAVAIPYAFARSADGTVTFAPGQSYPAAERAIGTIDFYITTFQSQTETAFFWDYELSPTASINSYAAYYRFTSPRTRPARFAVNTDVLGGETAFALGPLGSPFTEDSKLELQSALNTQISPGQTLSLGVNFIEDRSLQQQQRGSTFVDRAIARTSLFLIDDIRFGDQLAANLGVRYTDSTQFGAVLTPAAGIRFSPSRAFSLRANWSQVFNAPNISDLYTAGGVFVPNSDLRPETGITYDLGFDFTPASNLGLRFTYFNTTLDGAIATVFFRNPDSGDPNLFLQQQRNLDTRYASGLEVVGDWQMSDQWRLRLTWTNTDARFVGAVDSNDTRLFFAQYQDPNIPFNRMALAATYAQHGWSATLLGRYAGGRRRGEEPFGVPDYASVDLNFAIPVAPRFTLTGNLFNLTDTQYEYAAGIPAPGFTFRLGGRVELGG